MRDVTGALLGAVGSKDGVLTVHSDLQGDSHQLHLCVEDAR